MPSLLDWLFGRSEAVVVKPGDRAGVFRAGVSRTEDVTAGELTLSNYLQGDFIGLPNGTPFYMLDVFRFFRDTIPDISDAVWTWKRLCQTGSDIDIVDASSDVAHSAHMGGLIAGVLGAFVMRKLYMVTLDGEDMLSLWQTRRARRRRRRGIPEPDDDWVPPQVVPQEAVDAPDPDAPDGPDQPGARPESSPVDDEPIPFDPDD